MKHYEVNGEVFEFDYYYHVLPLTVYQTFETDKDIPEDKLKEINKNFPNHNIFSHKTISCDPETNEVKLCKIFYVGAKQVEPIQEYKCVSNFKYDEDRKPENIFFEIKIQYDRFFRTIYMPINTLNYSLLSCIDDAIEYTMNYFCNGELDNHTICLFDEGGLMIPISVNCDKLKSMITSLRLVEPK